MADVDDIVEKMRNNPANIHFAKLMRVCDVYFGDSRQNGSHKIYKTPWKGDPRINIQKNGNKAKTYQVKQVLKAIDKLKSEKY